MQLTMSSFGKEEPDCGMMEEMGFLQKNPDGSMSTYRCRWNKEAVSTKSGDSANKYLQRCFEFPRTVERYFTNDKLRCHRLASQVKVTPFIARRFARSARIMIHINRRTRKREISEITSGSLLKVLDDWRKPGDHNLMQQEVILSGGFAASEVPLYSDILTGHLDCLLCPEDSDFLYAIEVKSYPSDYKDKWAGTGKWRLNKNLVQVLAYAELLAKNTGCKRIAAGILHTQGILLFDASKWLTQDRTLLSGIRKHLTNEA